MDDREESPQPSNQTEARLVTLEHMSDEHADKVNHHQGALSSMDSDIGVMQAEFRRQHGMLQALHLTQQEQSIDLRELKAGQEELRLDHADLRRGMASVLVGVEAIRGLLERAEETDD